MKKELVPLSALLMALAVWGCGGDDDNGNTDDTDTGSAADTTTGTDGGVDDVEEDTGPPPGERLWISYTRTATSDAPGIPQHTQFVVVDEDCRPRDCDSEVVVGGDEPNLACDRGCAPTANLSHVVYLDPDADGTLRAVALTEDFELDGSSWVVANDVIGFEVGGNTLVYRTTSSVFAYDLDSQTEYPLGSIGLPGGFDVSADGQTVYIGDVTSLTSMTVNEVPATGGDPTEVYHFVAGMEQGTGSFYSGAELMDLSPDGRFLAVLTDAYVSSNECGSNADCTQEGELCLQEASPPRCVHQELSINVINLAERGQLGQTCSSDGDCGEGHFCDQSAPSAAACLPGRITVGPTGPNACDRLELGEYREARPEAFWLNNSEVAAIFSQDCIAGDIEATGIVAYNVFSGERRTLMDNPGESHGGDGCYDEVEASFVDHMCNVEADRMWTSPSGGTVAFVASSYSSRTTTEVWIMDALGRSDREMMTKSIDFDAVGVWVHAR